MRETLAWTLNIFTSFVFEEQFLSEHTYDEIYSTILKPLYPIFKHFAHDILGQGFKALDPET